MSPIDRTSKLLAHIRTQAAAWKRAAPATRSAGGRAPAGSGAAPARDWLAEVAVEVAAIPRDLPDRRRRAFRCYLQALLARECGIQSVHAREFQDLVDRVVGTMEANPKLREAMAAAGESLLESTEP